jgi:cytochrome b561
MLQTPSSSRYHGFSILLHWLIALMIIGALAVGLALESLPRDIRPFVINLHKVAGTTILALVVVRILWRFIAKPPALPADLPVLVRGASHAGHAALYLLMLLIPVSGLVMTFYYGYGIDFWLFKVSSPITADKIIGQNAKEAHKILAYIIMGVIGVHVLAALWHHYIRKDTVLHRMLP